MEKYDILIKDIYIIDGTGNPGFKGDIGIIGERIAKVGTVPEKADNIINGSGLTAFPGFIDIHNHADLTILDYPNADNFIMQGITTVVGGNCGLTLAPGHNKRYVSSLIPGSGQKKISWSTFSEFLETVENTGIAPNYVPMIGHNTVRASVMGDDYARVASAVEVARMNDLVSEAFRSGCHGFSVGLDGGAPGHFAEHDELIELLRTAKFFGGIFAPHTRHHQNQWPARGKKRSAYGIFDAPAGEIITGRYHGILEAIELSRLAGGIKLHIAHMTPAYILPQPHDRKLDEVLAEVTLKDIVEKAESEGVDITYNVIPSESSIGGKQHIIDMFFNSALKLPKWLKEMTPGSFIQALKSPDFKEKVRELMLSGDFKIFMTHPLTDPYWIDDYTILQCNIRSYVGRTLGELVKIREPYNPIKAVYETSFDILFEILVNDPDSQWVLSKDKREYGSWYIFLKHRLGIPCTDLYSKPAVQKNDTGVLNYGISPAEYRMFPRFLQTMTKEMNLLKLEEAVYKISGFPAKEILGIHDRGILKNDAFADIVIMDMENLNADFDFNTPERAAEGIEYVFINGSLAYEHGKLTHINSGKVLRKGKDNGSRK